MLLITHMQILFRKYYNLIQTPLQSFFLIFFLFFDYHLNEKSFFRHFFDWNDPRIRNGMAAELSSSSQDSGPVRKNTERIALRKPSAPARRTVSTPSLPSGGVSGLTAMLMRPAYIRRSGEGTGT